MPRKLDPRTIAMIETRGRDNIPASAIADEFRVSLATADRYARQGRMRLGLGKSPPGPKPKPIEIVEPFLDTPRSIAAHANGRTIRLQKDVEGRAQVVSYTVHFVDTGRSPQPVVSRETGLPIDEAITRFVSLYRRHIVGAAA